MKSLLLAAALLLAMFTAGCVVAIEKDGANRSVKADIAQPIFHLTITEK